MHLEIKAPGLAFSCHIHWALWILIALMIEKIVKIKNYQTATLLWSHCIILCLFWQCGDLCMKFTCVLIMFLRGKKNHKKNPKKCKLGNFQVFLQPDGAHTFWVALLSSPVPGLLLLHPCSCVSSQQYPQSCALVSAPQKQPRAKGDLSYSWFRKTSLQFTLGRNLNCFTYGLISGNLCINTL